MKTRFKVVDRENVTIRCHYCGHSVTNKEAQID